jgi:colanic acid biosynthesis glycosyl transferase WcaI
MPISSSVGAGAFSEAATGKPSVPLPARATAERRVMFYGMNYAPEMAGVGRYTGEIAEYMAKSGAIVSVVTTPPHYPGWRIQTPFRNGYAQQTLNGVRVLRCPLFLRKKMGGVWRLVAPLSFALASAPVAIWHVVRRRPHLIVCIEPTLFVAPMAILLAKLLRIRLVLHVQDLEIDAAFAVGHLARYRWLKRIGGLFERQTLRFFDRIITISGRMAEALVGKGVEAQRIDVVRNWVDLQHIFPLGRPSHYREKLGFSRDEFVVLYSGNIGPKQGLTVLLDAAKQLGDQTRFKFIIAGEGPAKPELVKNYGNLPNVQFLPFQPYEHLNEFLNMADLHALPQDRDTADLVLPSKLGAMLASGKEVLVTADADTELAAFLGDAGILTPSGDSAALAGAVKMVSERSIDNGAKKRLALSERLSKTDGLNWFCACIGVADERRRGVC